jgi:hypothetical protein
LNRVVGSRFLLAPHRNAIGCGSTSRWVIVKETVVDVGICVRRSEEELEALVRLPLLVVSRLAPEELN